jgi:two-component system cell cycle response regulator DivK
MKKVILIEDNENNLYLMRFMLTKLGHIVLEARDGAFGVDLAKKIGRT